MASTREAGEGSGLDSLFNPKSVAVVGASPIPTKVGNVILHNFVTNRGRGLFKGEVYPVNPKHSRILGVKCYPSLRAIGNPVETIVIAVPNDIVPEIMKDAAAIGVKGAIIITSGFSEIGRVDLEEEVKGIGGEAGIRIIGPNCLGIYDPYSGVDTLFLPEFKMLSTGREVLATPRPFKGPTVLISQSGALGVAALDYMAGHGMGVRSFVSLGNRADVAEHELLDHFAKDEGAGVILLYIEGLKEGRAFMEAAAKTTRVKPVIALKVGRTKAGAEAAASHTAALAGQDTIYTAAFNQTGVIRAENLEELFDFGRALSRQPPASGANVAIVTNGGGAGIMTADTCETSGVRVVDLPEGARRRFREMVARGDLLPLISNSNPLDLSGIATSRMYRHALGVLLEEPEIQGVIVITLHQTPSILDDVVGHVADLAETSVKPIVACDIGGTEMAEEIRSRFEKAGIPAYSTPERAARAMYSLMYYGRYLNSLSEMARPEAFFSRRVAAKVSSLIAQALAEGRRSLTEPEASRLCTAYGLPVAEWRLVKSEEEAVEGAEEVGFPVVAKIVSLDILHKTEAKAVITGLNTREEVREAYRRVRENALAYRPGARIEGVLIQRMAPPSTEVIVGMTRDPQFGPVVMFGVGGIFTEVLEDVSFHVAPVVKQGAEQMIRSIKAYPLLKGVRGREALDEEAVMKVILKVSQMALEEEHIEQMDLNPIFVYPKGVKVVDARILLS